jgi:DAACS family dicarboxylate/amino acid:cation (Na+ or H+) symporter
MLMAILASINVPPQAVLLILGIDRFLDMCRTVLNITGDLLIAVLVSRSEGRPFKTSQVPVEAISAPA